MILTRAAKLGGAPTVASRFVQRLAAVAGEARWDAALDARRAISRAGARKLDETAQRQAACRGPSPSRRSRRGRGGSSVTEIEDWLRDPYTIYAKHVLQAAAARRHRHAAGRGRPRHPDPRRDRRVRQDVRGRAARRSGARTAARSASGISRRWRISPRPGRSGGRAFCASPNGWRASRSRRRAQRSRALDAEIGGSIDNSVRRREVQAHRARRPHRAAARTAATPCSTTRPARRRATNRCSPDCRRSSRLKAAILRQGGFKDIAAGRNSGASSSMCGCAAAPWPAKRSRSSSRTARPTITPTARWRKLTRARRQVRRSGDALLLAAASDVDARTTAPTTISRACRNGR